MSMFWGMINAARDLGRVQEIAGILIRYGFGSVVQMLGMSQALERVGKTLHWQHAEKMTKLDTPQRLRRVLEELGPTFIKMGQIMATRVDLFPPAYIEEFGKLQDHAPPVDFSELLPQLEQDLGSSVDEVFLTVDKTPLAAASLAQVHRAVLEEGTEVILKIRRPGVRRVIEADLRLLNRLVDIIEADETELQRYHPREIVRQFSQSLRRELDFAAECRNAERVAESLKDNPYIVIPKVYWAWTGERLNVQQYIRGVPGNCIDQLDEAGLSRKLLAERGTEAILKMVMEDGFFHADPHPGNVIYLPGNRLAFLDFGMVGRLTEDRRDQVVSFLYGMVNQMPERVVQILEDWSDVIHTDEQQLSMEIEAFVDQYSSLALKDVSLPTMMTDLMSILRDHNLSLPPDLALLIKAYITLDGFGRHLDPDFQVLVFATPYIQRLMVERYRPDAVAKRGWRNVLSMADMLAAFPKEMHHLLRATRKGLIPVEISVKRLDSHVDKIDRAVSRLTMGIVTAALIIGTSIMMTVKGGPEIMGLPAFGFFGYIFAALGGIWLLFSIWRSGRRH